MEKKHLKRLGYGFSALVMALSAVSFVPTANTYAATQQGIVAENTDVKGVKYAKTYVMKVGDRVDINSLVRATKGYEITSVAVVTAGNDNTPDDGSSLVVTRPGATGDIIEARAKGHRTYNLTASFKNTSGEATGTIDFPVMFYVWDDAVAPLEYSVYYLSLNDDDEHTDLDWYYNADRQISNDSKVTYSGDVVKKNGKWYVDTSTLGVKTVEITETIAGKQVTDTVVVKFVICGIELPNRIDFFADSYYDLDLAGKIYGAQIGNGWGILNLRGGISMNRPADDLFQFDAHSNHLNQYTAWFSARKVEVEGYSYNDAHDYRHGDTAYMAVNVHDRLAILDEDTTIDVAEGSSDNTAKFVLNNYDGTLTYTSNIYDEEKHDMFRVTFDRNTNTWTYTATKYAVPGEYEVTFTQSFGEDVELEHTETRTIVVVDSSIEEPEDPSEPGTDEPGTNEPGTDEPGTDEPGNDNPTTPGNGDNNNGGNTTNGGNTNAGTGLGAGSAISNDGTIKTPDTGFNTVATTTATAKDASANTAIAATAVIAATTMAGAAILSKRNK